jgi:tRNA(Ile)-lysidine synthase
MATLARDEEAWWQAEMARLGPHILMSGRPVRGGGRAAGDPASLSLDVTRLAEFAPAVQRRLLRYAAEQLGAAVDFPSPAVDFHSTEALRALALLGRAGQRLELANGLRAERSARELRLVMGPAAAREGVAEAISEYSALIPGEIHAPAFGLRLQIAFSGTSEVSGSTALLRNWKPGDRVRLRYSSGPRKVKEVLERLRVSGSDRRVWPVLEVSGRIVWMKGVELEPEQGIEVEAAALSDNLDTGGQVARKAGTLGVE